MGDSREKVETAEFWLTAPRYLQQAGQSEPQYVNASPTSPVVVILPATTKVKGGEGTGAWEDKHLKPCAAGKPEKPKPAHPGIKEKVKHVAEAFVGYGKRAADK